MDEFRKKLLTSVGFDKEVKNVELGNCPFCGLAVKENEFRDELSKREFKISGICQTCQDDFFGRKE